jgi:hypothetical protein
MSDVFFPHTPLCSSSALSIGWDPFLGFQHVSKVGHELLVGAKTAPLTARAYPVLSLARVAAVDDSPLRRKDWRAIRARATVLPPTTLSTRAHTQRRGNRHAMATACSITAP